MILGIFDVESTAEPYDSRDLYHRFDPAALAVFLGYIYDDSSIQVTLMFGAGSGK